jgi:beta-glucosidase
VEDARGGHQVSEVCEQLISELTTEQLLWLLDGDTPVLKGLREMGKRYNAVPIEAGRIDELGIPGIRFTDGPRGVVMGSSTAFPAAIARAASFDIDLEQRIGDAIGAEARAQGANLFAGICVNLAPAPGWGRSQESYGEDPVLLGEMGSALAEGVRPWVMSCVKHFALNSMEEARFEVDVRVAQEVLHEVYLPHFRRVVDGGADAVMSSYNSVNGTWAGENPYLLTAVLREQWGFEGFVMTDFVWGLRHPVESVAAGQDLEMPFRQQRAAALPVAVRDGRLGRADIEAAASRILSAQIRLALRARPTPEPHVVACAEHRALAREAAVLGTVMLRNEDVLPLPPNTSVAVLGRFADKSNLGDVGSSQVVPPSTVSILEGLREQLHDLVRRPENDTVQAAVEAARDAATAVVVVGLSSVDEGEAFVSSNLDAIGLLGPVARNPLVGRVIAVFLTLVGKLKKVGGDRRDLHLHESDVALIQAVARVNPRTVVVVVAGGTVMCDPWESQVGALLLAWYPGMEGGRALADVLLGTAEPGGRLPVAIPVRREDLPEVDWKANRVAYGRWWGQRKLDRDHLTAAHPFGFGLGYTTMVLRSAEMSGPETVEVEVANTGSRDGRHVVQVYARAEGGEAPVLVGFAPVRVPAATTVTVSVPITLAPLQRWTEGRMVDPDEPVRLTVASYAGDPQALSI